jgi:hypothetical protein
MTETSRSNKPDRKCNLAPRFPGRAAFSAPVDTTAHFSPFAQAAQGALRDRQVVCLLLRHEVPDTSRSRPHCGRIVLQGTPIAQSDQKYWDQEGFAAAPVEK